MLLGNALFLTFWAVISFANPPTGDQGRERGRLQLRPWAGRALQGALGMEGTALAMQRDAGDPAAAAPGEGALAVPGAEPQQRPEMRLPGSACGCTAARCTEPAPHAHILSLMLKQAGKKSAALRALFCWC